MRFLVLIFAALLGSGWAHPAMANDQTLALVKELVEQVKALNHRVDQANNRITELEMQLQQARNAQSATGNSALASAEQSQQKAPAVLSGSPQSSGKAEAKPAITVGDVKGTFKIPGTDTSIGIGGFVKTDFLFSSVSTGSNRYGDQSLVLSQIPVGGAPGEHSQMTMHAKESRLWFKSFTPSQWGDINTLIEMDFFGDPATYVYTPRLRHAYGSMGNFLAGQTWTTFLNASALPEVLDIGGSAGAVTSLRQPLVRWSQPFKLADSELEWQAAVEAPRTRIWDGYTVTKEPHDKAYNPNPNTDDYFSNPNADRYPDLIARLNYNGDWGNLSLAALGRQVRYTNSKTGLEQGLWGGGVSLAGKITTVGLDNIRFMTHYGNGAGRYISTNNTFSDASLDIDGNMQLTTTYGGMFSYQHWWNNQWRSTLTYGFSQAEQPDFVNTVLNHQVQSVHANLLWNPINQAMFGLEYIYATRELIDGMNGDLQRLQLSARYNF